MKDQQGHNLPSVAKFLRAYLRMNLRGQTRLTFLLAGRMRALQFVPITVADCEPFYVDLRNGQAHFLLKGTPWRMTPWEQAEQDVIRRIVKPGDVSYDIGANIGIHTVLLSKLIEPEGRLCVFEPNVELLPQIGRTVEGLDNATLYPYALSDKSEVATLFVPEDHSMGSLANWTEGRAGSEIHTALCEVRRMDELIASAKAPQPDFIKCDVEGAELMVFRGGYKALNRPDGPVIMFEANVYNAAGFGLKVEDASNFLAELPLPKYAFYEIQENGGLAPMKKHNPIHSNILALPEQRLSRLREALLTGSER